MHLFSRYSVAALALCTLFHLSGCASTEDSPPPSVTTTEPSPPEEVAPATPTEVVSYDSYLESFTNQVIKYSESADNMVGTAAAFMESTSDPALKEAYCDNLTQAAQYLFALGNLIPPPDMEAIHNTLAHHCEIVANTYVQLAEIFMEEADLDAEEVQATISSLQDAMMEELTVMKSTMEELSKELIKKFTQ